MIVTKKCLWRTWQVQSTSAENVVERKEVKILLSLEEHLLGKTRPAHIGLRQTGEPINPLASDRTGHSEQVTHGHAEATGSEP